MNQRNFRRIAGAFLSLAFIAAPIQAMETEDGPEIRVVNNHTHQVSVFVIDGNGVYHALGRLAPRDAGVFRVAEAAEGPLQVKVVVDEPVWSLGNTEEAIRSSDITIDADEAIQLWIEPDLTASAIELVQ